ncbi:MAG: N-acetylmuramoyl-L-alanine amidase, partial [Phycisphaerae bacterium]|jgi:N-acetylmuramoyl-L-alanine amidase|nr:N-acetylmuramoyl-L-alanine amidase [Phycisphaerae bacterium]
MVRHLLGAGLPSRGYRPPPGNGTFRVLRRTECPAVLVEMGYLSNARDAEMLGRWEFRRRLADLIAEVIIVHLTK